MPISRSPYRTYFYLALLLAVSLGCLFGYISAAYALAIGLLIGWFSHLLINSEFSSERLVTHTKKLPKYAGLLLKAAIVILGFTLPIEQLTTTATDSFVLTLSLIAGILIIGLLLARWLKLDNSSAWLISSGTAICGGSAIAAVGSSIKAEQSKMVVALAVVFILNALALFIFPPMGHWLELSQQQFGLWAALAIHDTSSVVAAAAAYGNEALTIATSSKLSRALWIIPVALIASLSNQKGQFKLQIPWFILLFIGASLFTSSFGFSDQLLFLKPFAKSLFALSLLWMGLSLNRTTLKAVPINSLILGIILWLLVSLISLWLILNFY